MAVKTNISKNELIVILSGYSLGTLLEFRPISEGTVQTNYHVKTSNTEAVLRYYENRSMESVRFEANLIRYLYDKGFPCPAPLMNKHGRFIGIFQNKPYVLFEFVDGVHISNLNETQRSQLIEQVARLHSLTKSHHPEYAVHRLNYNMETCRKLAQENADRINTRNSQEKLQWYINQLDKLQLPRSLPMGICHCDFHPTNILFLDGEFKALLDFDDANYTYLVFDLVYLLEPFKAAFDWNTWSNFKDCDDVFDFAAARSVLSEYMKYRKLNSNEKRHLFDVYKLSILVDCIWYFERGDVGDFFEKRKLDYLDSLGREGFYQALFG
jgi:homoserine kinase type II